MADIMMRVPEFILLETLENALKFVRNDFADQMNEQDTYLYKMLQGTQFQRYDFFEQAKQVICGDIDDPRRLECDLIFNFDRNGAPTIHINLPSEMSTQDNGMGIDEGYVDNIYTDGDVDTPGSYHKVWTRRFQAVYNIVITSDNTNEVIFLFHFVRALLLSTYDHLSLSGLQNITFGGQDIQPYSDLIPPNLFMRAISVNLQYETSAISFSQVPMFGKLVFRGKAVDDTKLLNNE